MKNLRTLIICAIIAFGTTQAFAKEVGRSQGSQRAKTNSTRNKNVGASVDAAGFNCALKEARNYLKTNASAKGLDNSKYITLVDLDAPPNVQRMLIVDAGTGQVVERHTVANGSEKKNGKGGINTEKGSNGSELGFMKVSEPYSGKHGASVRIDGLEAGNTDVRSRDIVIHGAWYVKEGGTAGHSQGCFAMDNDSVASAIQKLKGGSLLYSYQSSKVCH